MAVSSAPLADSVTRFVLLFEPLAGAILAHQHAAALRHAAETTWRVPTLRALIARPDGAQPSPRTATTERLPRGPEARGRAGLVRLGV